MTFCSRTSYSCQRFLHVDRHLKKTGSLQHLPVVKIGDKDQFNQCGPKHIHNGNNKLPGQDPKTKQDADTSSLFSFFQDKLPSLDSPWKYIKELQISLDLANLKKPNINFYPIAITNRIRNIRSSKTKVTEDSKVSHEVPVSLERESKSNILEREDFKRRGEIDAETKRLFWSLSSMTANQHVIPTTEKIINHLLKYPDARNVADELDAIDILRQKKRRCKTRKQMEIINRALVLMGYVGPPRGDGLRVLTLDGGGIRGLCAIEALRRIEDEYNKQLRKNGILRRRDINQMFDYVCGVSTGSLLAAMVFLFRVPLTECREMYMSFSEQMFGRSNLKKVMYGIKDMAMYNTKVWEDILSSTFEDRIMMEYGALEHIPKLSGISCIDNVSVPTRYIFRTYNLPPNVASYYPGSCKYRAQDMVRASSAAPFYYKPLTLDQYNHIDGGIFSNNPSAVAVHECKLLWPHEPIRCLISLGTGHHQHTVKILNGTVKNNLIKTGIVSRMYASFHSATDTEEIHTLLSDIMPENSYFRFSPYLNDPVDLASIDENTISTFELASFKYMNNVQGKVKKAVKQLMLEKKNPIY